MCEEIQPVRTKSSDRIPPAEAGGSSNPDLQDARNTLESGRRKPVDRSFPACRLNNQKQRPGMNGPPASAGGIHIKLAKLARPANLVILVILVILATAAFSAGTARTKPNIIFIQADD